MVERTPNTRTPSIDLPDQGVLSLHRNQAPHAGISVPDLRAGQVHVWATALDLPENITSDYADWVEQSVG